MPVQFDSLDMETVRLVRETYDEIAFSGIKPTATR